MIRKVEDEIKLAEEILRQIQSQTLNRDLSIHEILFKYRFLVITMEKSEEIKWADQELNGYKNIKDIPFYRELKPDRETNIFKLHGYILDSLDKIESRATADHPFYEYMAYIKNKSTSDKILVTSECHRELLNTLRDEIYKKTANILLGLKYGKMESDIFEETRGAVNKKLQDICPKALNKLIETYEDLTQNKTPLDLQQIAVACRIVLKDFADIVYPPSNQLIQGVDKKNHTVKEDEYINRILAYVQQNTNSNTDSEFIESYLCYLSKFLFNINKLANVGTHNERSVEHAKRCVIYTYLVLGDIINITNLQINK
jgi:hypothetical protein